MSAPSSPLTRVRAQAGLELRLLLRSGESLLVTFGVPLGILLLFGTTDLLPTASGEGPLDFLVPGVLAVAILSTGFVAQAIQTGFDRKYGVLKRLGATPLTRPQYLAGKAAAVAVVVVAQVAVLLGVASLLGWQPGPTPPAPGEVVPLVLVCEALFGCSGLPVPPVTWLVPVGVVVGAVVFTALGLTLAGAVRAELVLAGSNALYLMMLAGTDLVFDLPEAAAPFVAFTPSGALGIVLRRGLEGATEVHALVALAVLIAWGVLAVIVASRTFRWEA